MFEMFEMQVVMLNHYINTTIGIIHLLVVLMVVTCFACKAAYLPEGTCNVGVFQCFKSERHLQGGNVPMSQIWGIACLEEGILKHCCWLRPGKGVSMSQMLLHVSDCDGNKNRLPLKKYDGINDGDKDKRTTTTTMNCSYKYWWITLEEIEMNRRDQEERDTEKHDSSWFCYFTFTE